MLSLRIDKRWFTVSLDPAALDTLQATGTYEGPVKLVENVRLAAVADQVKRPIEHRIVRSTLVQRQIIRAWNYHPYMSAKPAYETRNRPWSIAAIAENLPLLSRAIREVGPEEINRQINLYFAACERGEHIWDKMNHGYSHLGGMLLKLIELAKTKGCSWWSRHAEIPGETSEPTQLMRLIADSFAKNFGGQSSNAMTSEDWKAFRLTADRVEVFVQNSKQRNRPVSQREVVRWLLLCLQQQAEKSGEAVKLGTLYSSNMWVAILPQFLKEGGFV